MQTTHTTATKSLATAGPGIDRRRREARRWKTLHQQFSCELPHGAGSAATEALLGSLTGLTVRIENMNRSARRGEDVDDDTLLRLTSQQSRLLRQLGLAGPLEQRNPQRRLSLTARNLESAIEGRATTDPFGEIGEHVAAQRAKLEQLAAKYNFSIDLCDSSKGGRLNEHRLYELLKEGKESKVRRLIEKAAREHAEAQRLTAAGAESDDDSECKHRQRRKDHCWVERNNRFRRATVVVKEGKKHRDR